MHNAESELSQRSEAIIWRKIKDGNTVALGELYDQYIDVLFVHGMRKSNQKAEVMDCIHDLFLDLYKYRKKLADTDNVSYYLMSSLSRKINKKYRKRVAPISNDDFIFEKAVAIDHYTASYESEVIQKERTTERNLKLSKALDTLTEKQKKGLFLRFDQDKPYEEIAQIMEVSIETARTTIYRALKVLRKQPFSMLLLLEIGFI